MATVTAGKKKAKKAATPVKVKADGKVDGKGAGEDAYKAVGKGAVKAARKGAGKVDGKVDGKVNGKGGLPAVIAGTNGTVPARPLTQAGVRTMIQALGPGAFEAYTEVEGMFRTQEQTALSFWWNIGKKFLAIADQWKAEGLRTFCELLNKDHREVRSATRWSEQDVIGMVEEARKHNGSVTWSHMRLLLALDDADCDRYLKYIQRNKVGYDVLFAKIKAERAPEEPEKKKEIVGGRTFHIPGDFEDLYQVDMKKQGEYARFYDQMDKKLPDAIEKIDEEGFNPALLARVRTMRSRYDAALALIQRRTEQLILFERRIEQKLGLDRDEIPQLPPPMAPTSIPALDTQALIDAVAVPIAAVARKPPAAAKKKG
jgi:hypothetical protein